MAEASKVVFGGETVVDLTQDTVSPEMLLEGVTAHNNRGEEIVGIYKEGDGSGSGNNSEEVFPLAVSISLWSQSSGTDKNGTLDVEVSMNSDAATKYRSAIVESSYAVGNTGTALKGDVFGNPDQELTFGKKEYSILNGKLSLGLAFDLKNSGTDNSLKSTISLSN